MSSMVVDRGCQLEAKFIGSGRCLPVARGRAGSEGHVWPWNPTSPRRRAFHSNVPPPPSLSLSLSLSFFLFSLFIAALTYLPRAYVFRFFRTAVLSPRPAPARSDSPSSGQCLRTRFLPSSRDCFSRISPRISRRPTSHIACNFTESSQGKISRDRDLRRSLLVITVGSRITDFVLSDSLGYLRSSALPPSIPSILFVSLNQSNSSVHI